MVWTKGNTDNGHVSIVERIDSDNQIYTSESCYNGRAFYNCIRMNSNGRWGMSSGYTFRGCIVNPAVAPTPTPTPTPTERKVGDVVTINGVYRSSTSTEKLVPAVKTGTITKIVSGARNPYLLNNGNIGWVNDDCIVDSSTPSTVGQTKKLRDVTNLYSNPDLTGTEYTYLPNTTVKILENVPNNVDYVYIPATGRYAYCKNNVYK